MLDLSRLGEDKRRWIDLGGALAGVEVEIRHVGPKDQEKFRRRLINNGILKPSSAGHEINSGREMDFFKAYAAAYVTDWRGPIVLNPGEAERPAYSPDLMARVFGAYGAALEAVTRAVGDETLFFSENGNASTG